MLICQQDPAMFAIQASDSFVLPAPICWLPQDLNLLVQTRAIGCIMPVISFNGLLSGWWSVCDEPKLCLTISCAVHQPLKPNVGAL